MALLFRFVKLADRAETHVFTFIVTKSVTRDLERDITSKEFSCGHQRWAITFSRTDKVLGVYLVWRSSSDAMRVYVDFSFTLLNRDHFSHNESFSGKQVKFTTECPAQGNRNYIAVSELYVRNFADNNGEFQLELSMGHIRTMFDTEFRVPSSIFGHQLQRHHHHQGSTKNPQQATKLETTYFTYGGFDWNLALYPHGTKDLHGLCFQGVVRVHLEMLMANTLSEVVSTIVVQHAGSSAVGAAVNNMGVVVAAPAVTQCYDRDKQAWCIKSDCHSETVRLHMIYKDIHNVPRNHLRYVCWMAYLLRYDEESGEMVPKPLQGAPFSHYYAQDVSDEGIIMETDVGVKELREPDCPYLTDKGQMRVQVVWTESYLLFQSTYHKYDDISRTQGQQMRREITTLQAENYSLERQLFSYQKSIAYAHSRGTYSSYDPTTPDGRGEDEEDERYYDERGYSAGLGDRAMSSDTEYA